MDSTNFVELMKTKPMQYLAMAIAVIVVLHYVTNKIESFEDTSKVFDLLDKD